MVRSFLFGIFLPLEALRLIVRKRSLLLLSILPVLVTALLYVWVLGRLRTESRAILHSYLMNWGWNPEGFWAGIVFFLAGILIWIAGAFTFSFAAGVVASPFNDFLAEKTETFATPPLVAAPKRGWKGQARLIFIDITKSVLVFIAGVLALLCSWIPVINIGMIFIAFLLLSFQFISYPQTRRGQGFRESLSFLWKRKFACCGFGAALSVLFSLPLLSTLVLPLAVVGGTLLFARPDLH